MANIRLTDTAVRHVKDYLARHEGGVGLRLGVKTTGCSGFAYTVDYAEIVEETDEVIEQDGIKLLISRKSLPFLEGTEVDFIREGLNHRFDFRNPNVKDTCGCGESFTV